MAKFLGQRHRDGRDRHVLPLAVFLMISTLVPLLILTFLSWHYTSRGLINARLDALRQSSNDGARHIALVMETLTEDGQTISGMGSLADYVRQMAGPTAGGGRVNARVPALDRMVAELGNLIQAHRFYEGFALIDPSGREIIAVRNDHGRIERLADSALGTHPAMAASPLINALARPSLLPFRLDADEGDDKEAPLPSLALFIPIDGGGGARLGYVVLPLKSGVLPHLLDGAAQSGQTMTLLVTQQGRVISGWMPPGRSLPAALNRVLGAGWAKAVRPLDQVLSNIGGYSLASRVVEWDGQGTQSWLVLSLCPRADSLAPLQSLGWALLFLLLGSTVLALITGILFNRRLLLDPVGELLAVLAAVRDGDFTVRAPVGAGELGHLGEAINDMVTAVAERRCQLTATVAERTEALHREMSERQTAQNFLMDAVEAMQDAFLVFDENDRLVLCNNLTRRTLPLDVASKLVPGAAMRELLEAGARSGNITAAVGREEEWVRERLEAHRRPFFAHEERLDGGRWLDVRSWRTPSRACVIIWSDITPRKQAQRDLQMSERRFRALFDNMQDAALVLRAEDNGDSFRITDLNHAAQVMDRIEREAVLGKSLDEVFPALRRLGKVEAMGRVWREHRPERQATFFYDDPAQPSWRDMSLFPLSTGEVVAIYRDVTTECESEEALLRSEERYRILVETMSEGLIVTDPDLTIAYVNDRFAQLAGRAQRDLVGHRLDEAFHPESRDMLAHWGGRLQFGRAEVYEAVLDAGGGARVEVLVSPAPFYDAAGTLVGKMSVVTDITPLKQAQAALRDSESRFRSIFLGAPFGMVLVAGDGTLAEVNRAFQTIFDVTPAQVIGLPLAAFGLGELAEKVGLTGAWSWEGQAALPDGRSAWLRAHAAQVADPGGGPPGIIATVEDISRRKELEERMSHSSKLMLLGEMSAGLAHEITQPLNVIRLTSEATLARIDGDGVSMEEARAKLKIINDQADRLFDVIDYMQAFSRRESERREPFDLFASLRAAVALVTESFRQKRIHIETDLPAGPCVLLGHARQLEQVVLNLLTNARDAITDKTGTAGGTIHVSGWRHDAEGRAGFMVDDEGHGISADKAQKIFEPFFSTKGPGKGTGLGLSISLGIVSGLGGTMTAGAAPGGGARFSVDLPLAQIGDEALLYPPQPEADEIADIPPANRVSAHILVVEDEELAAGEMADFLERGGYRVTVCHGGAEAMAAFLADPADLVVTDLNMPEGDGRALIDALMGDYPYLPIIVVTGRPNTREGELEEAASGADVVLRKPIRLRELSDHIGRLLA
ncbi:sporulation kinase E [mine drainage metagenome]|uniref:histidine kinase n=1 Tax=mine drainage metagenome TaxID=410659 RepID=A0A1J5QVD6_9ZZZZ